MTVARTLPRWRRVFHPTDLSRGSELAFVHAVRLALALGAELDMVHVGRRKGNAFRNLPGVRETVARWRRVQGEDFPKAPVQVRKTSIRAEAAGPALLEHLEGRPAELVVLTTHQRQGWDRLRHGDLAVRLAREARRAALLLPAEARGFVDPRSGRFGLTRVLLPVDHRPSPQSALNRLVRWLDRIVEPRPEGLLVHVRNGSREAPELEAPSSWSYSVREGEPEQEILRAAIARRASLIAMASAGRRGLGESFRGSFTERIVRGSDVPVLLLPRTD